MPNAAVTCPPETSVPERVDDTRRRAVVLTAQWLADAEAEFDAALDEHRPMFALVRLDQEVVAATRRHQAALAGG